MPEPLTTRILRQLTSQHDSVAALARRLRESVPRVQRCVAALKREKRVRQAREDRRLLWAARGGKRGPAMVAVWDVTETGRAEVCDG